MHEYPYRTCAEIDLNKLQRNLQRLRALIGPDCRIMEVMKADAYGHGLRVCAEYAAPYVDWFAAATLEEALAVRAAAPHTPILIFGGLLDPEIIQAAQHGLTINVFSLQYASHVQALLQPMGLHADVHIKVDTGMNRLGHIYALRLCRLTRALGQRVHGRAVRSLSGGLQRTGSTGHRPRAAPLRQHRRPARASGIPLPDGARRHVRPRHELQRRKRARMRP